MLPGVPVHMSLQFLHRRRCSEAERTMKTERKRTGSSSACAEDWTRREAEVGALGLLIYQAAKGGSSDGLRFALSRRGGEQLVL